MVARSTAPPAAAARSYRSINPRSRSRSAAGRSFSLTGRGMSDPDGLPLIVPRTDAGGKAVRGGSRWAHWRAHRDPLRFATAAAGLEPPGVFRADDVLVPDGPGQGAPVTDVQVRPAHVGRPDQRPES